MLSPQVLDLERTWHTFKDLLEDDRITVHLPKNTYCLPHFKSVAASLVQKGFQIKFGITNDPHERFCVRNYAYTKTYAQKRDGVRYTGMVVVFVHH